MPIPLGSTTADLTGPGTPGATLHDGLVVLGDVTLGTTDDNGVEWILEKLTGWVDAPGSSGSSEQRTATHGANLNEAFYTARTLELEGSIVADNWDAAEEAVDRLMAAVPVNIPAPLLVLTNRRAMGVDVRQEGDPLVEILKGHARFSLSLIAPDPRRYSLNVSQYETALPVVTGGLVPPVTPPVTIIETSESGRFTARNDGNMATSPVFTIHGPCPAWSITHLGLGKRLWSNTPIPAGRFIVLDAAERMARLDGIALRTVSGSWFDFAPGDNEVAFTAASYDSGALLEVSYRSAWR